MKTAEQTSTPSARPREATPAREDAPRETVAGRHALAATVAAAAGGVPPPPGAPATAAMVRLQRIVGNAQVQRMIARAPAVGPEGGAAPEEVEEGIGRARGGGTPLGPAVREEMETHIGADFSGVRVHTGGEADTLNRSLGARAFATGPDLFFRGGEFSPGTPQGKRLLAHELTHVVQQSVAPAPARRSLEVGPAGDDQEREAEQVADAVASTPPAPAPPAAPDAPGAPGDGDGRPSIRRAPAGGRGALRRDPAPGTAAPAAPGPERLLGPTEDFRWAGPANAPFLVVSRRWLVRSRVPAGTRTVSGARWPLVMRPVLSALVDVFPWASPRRAEIVARTDLGLIVPRGEWAHEEIQFNLAHSVFLILGLPAGAPVQLFRRGSGVEVYADLRTLYPDGADAAAMAAARPGIAERVVARLEEETGASVLPTVRAGLLAWVAGRLPATREVAVVPLSERDLRRAFGEQAWEQARARRQDAPEPGSAVIRLPGGGYALPPGTSENDRRKVEAVLRQLFGPAPGAAAPAADQVRPLGEADVAALLAVERLPAARRAQLAAAVHALPRTPGAAPRSMADVLEGAVAEADRRAAAARVGHTLPAPGAAPPPDVPPVVARPVHGDIAYQGTLVPGMHATFEFQLRDAVDYLRVPHVDIDWYAVPAGSAPGAAGGRHERTSYIEVRGDSVINDRTFETSFDAAGLYEVHAFVNHNFYLPAHFVKRVEVATEHERLGRNEFDTAGAFGVAGAPAAHQFSDVRADDIVTGMVGGIPLAVLVAAGEDSYARGYRSEGTLAPAALAQPGASLGERRRQLAAQIAQLDTLITGYGAVPEQADVVEWATARRGRLQTALDALAATAGDPTVKPVVCQAYFVPRRAGVQGGALSLACWFTWQAGAGGGAGTWRGHIYDHSEIAGGQDLRLEGDGSSYGAMMERLFFELTRSYPDGSMSFSYQVYEGLVATPRFMRLERVTDTLRTDIRDVAFSEPVSLAVNIAATVLTVFPPTAPVGIGISLAYNGASAASSFGEAARTGTLHASNYVDVGLVALDVIPLLGRGARTLEVGGLAYRAISAARFGGMAYTFSAGVYQQVQQLRDGRITQLAELDAQIAANSSDPEIDTMRRRRAALVSEIRGAVVEILPEAAATQGLTLTVVHTAGAVAQAHLGRPAAPAHPDEPGAARPAPGEEHAPPRPAGAADEPHAARPDEPAPGLERLPEEAVRRPARPGVDAGLTAALPADLRGRVAVLRGPPPEAHAVEVHYATDRLGLVTDVYVRAGPHATAEHVLQHAQTVRLMERFQGFSGAVRVVWERLRALVARRGAAVPGSALWEAQLEVEKLPGIISENARLLRDQGLDPGVRADIEAHLGFLRGELERFGRVVEQGIDEAGEGFVAARVAASNDRAHAAGRPRLEGANAAPDHYYFEPTPGVFELRRYANSAAPAKQLSFENGRWRVIDRPEGPRGFAAFLQNQIGSFGTAAPARIPAVEAAITAHGRLDAGGAAVARRWGDTLQALHAGAGGGAAGDAMLAGTLQRLGAATTETTYGNFRREVRNQVVQQALAQPVTPGAADARVTRLRALLDAVPDPRTMGKVFTLFRERLAGVAGSTVDYLSPVRPASVDIPGDRHADGNLNVTRQVQGGPPPGRYLSEDKAGANAFKADQAQAYSDQLRAGTGTIRTLDGQVFAGIVYAFENEPAGRAALATVRGLHPNIRVGAFTPDGRFIWLR